MILEKIIFTLLFKWKYLIAILHSKFKKKIKIALSNQLTMLQEKQTKIGYLVQK